MRHFVEDFWQFPNFLFQLPSSKESLQTLVFRKLAEKSLHNLYLTHLDLHSHFGRLNILQLLHVLLRMRQIKETGRKKNFSLS